MKTWYLKLIKILAVLKVTVDFVAKLIRADTAKTPAEDGARETPQALSAEEAVSTREPHAPRAEINSQVATEPKY
ncbi:hypothetical protein [Neobacillus drentensis]|uniref:hypothetical protein n=1 Tax=Neobacillus drentensis TaxID=220684 RepID=UPI0030011CAB